MCYSAMVEQDAKRLAREFNAKVAHLEYEKLFKRRLEGERLYINTAMEIPFLKSASSMQEKSIASTIRKWRSQEIDRLTNELSKQKSRLANAEKALQVKETKKALEDKRISTSKISKCEYDIKKMSNEKSPTEAEQKIFPYHYVSVLCLDEKGESIIMPMRYLMRPHNEGEEFDRTHSGCYNARFDSLTKVPFWKNSLEKHRGLLVVKKFYENVPIAKYPNSKKLPQKLREKENIVVCFEPKGVDEMYIPILWDLWKKKGQPDLYSAALITDEPAPEVQAAGHDRTPIFLKKSAVNDWLRAEGSGKEIKEKFLFEREKPYYEHEVEGVA